MRGSLVSEPLPDGPTWPARHAVFARPGLTAATAAALGWAVDLLALRRPVGFGASLAMLVGVGVVGAAAGRHRPRPGELRWLIPAATAAALFVGWRASPVVAGLNVIAYILMLVVAIRLHDGVPLTQWTIADYIWRGASTATGVVGESARFLRHDVGRGHLTRFRRLGPVLAGLLVSIPLVLLFLVLFMSADAVFAEYVERVLSIDVELARILSRVFTTSLLALAIVGVWRGVRSGFRPDVGLPDRKPVGSVTVTTTLSVITALFSTFLLVQITYLFGGRSVLDVVDMTYAEYARRGFFEMVAVALLVVVVVAMADFLVHTGNRRFRSVDIASAILVMLTFGVVASAVVRMRLYTAEFGLTELRFYTSVFMVWTAVVLVLLLTFVLRGDRARFAFGMFVSGLAVIGAMSLANPDGVIATVNAGRSAEGVTARAFDTAYVTGLSPDAFPALVAALDRLEAPCPLAAAMQTGRVAEDRDDWGWRSMTVSHLVAEDLLADLPDC